MTSAGSSPRVVNSPPTRLLRFTLLALVLFFGLLEVVFRLVNERPCSSAALQEEYLRRVGSRQPQTLNESLRRSSPMPYDPYLLWHLVANFQGENLGAQVIHNSRGFRSPEIPVEKANGTFRLLLLGDSTIYGHGVSEGEVLRARLEALLKAAWPGKPIEVINGGVPGYSSLQSLNLYRRFGREYRSDVVVIANLWSDCVKDRFEDKKVIYGEGGAALGKRWLQQLEEYLAPRSAFYCAVKRGVSRVRPTTCQGLPPLCAPPPEMLSPRGGDRAVALEPRGGSSVPEAQTVRQPGADGKGAQTVRVALEDYQNNLSTLIEEARADGATPMLVILSSGVDVGELSDPEGTLGDYPQYRRTLLEVADRYHVPVVNMVEAFRAAAQGGPYFMDRVHPNGAGNQVMARALFQKIQEEASIRRLLEGG